MLPLITAWIMQMTVVRQSDLDVYKTMSEERAIASSHQASSSNQERKQVRKDIWFSQDDNSRLHYHIASESSLLTLTPIKNSFEVVETLQGIKCWMQDKLFITEDKEEPMQQSRYIEAEEGLYRYSTQEFTANGVALSLYRLPGHLLPTESIDREKAFLHGKAHDVSFFFSGKTPQFQARQFQAVMVKDEP